MGKQGDMIIDFYTRLVGKVDEDVGECEITFSFTGRDNDKPESTTVLLLNGFMPTFDDMTLHVLGDKNEKKYKNLWTISMVLSYDNWFKFVSLANKMNMIFTCEKKNLRTGSRNLFPIFHIGCLFKGPWEYTINSYCILHNFKWGSLRTFVTKQGCRIRIQIEEPVQNLVSYDLPVVAGRKE